MNSQFIYSVLVILCMAIGLDAAKKYKLSGKKIEAGKYARRCEKDELEILNLNESKEIEEVAAYLLKNNVNSVWIAGIKGVEYDGEVLLNVEAKKKGKYGSHTFTLVPAKKVKKFSGEHFALCRRAD